MIRRAFAGLVAFALAAAVALAGCGDGGRSAGTPQAADGAVNGTVTVFAAASLTEAFTELGHDFEAKHDGVTVRFNFAGSSTLAQQINQGAPADLFAAASPTTMARVVDDRGVAGEPVTFVRNRLEIVVPAGNPGGVRGLADFARADLKLALCAEQVPCGAAAAKVFRLAEVGPRPDTLEQDVKAALTKVRLGEVDAALVYRTDVRAAGEEVEGIEFPESGQAVNDYPLALLKQAPNPAAAKAFRAYLRSPAGQSVLARSGFDQP